MLWTHQTNHNLNFYSCYCNSDQFKLPVPSGWRRRRGTVTVPPAQAQGIAARQTLTLIDSNLHNSDRKWRRLHAAALPLL